MYAQIKCSVVFVDVSIFSIEQGESELSTEHIVAFLTSELEIILKVKLAWRK